MPGVSVITVVDDSPSYLLEQNLVSVQNQDLEEIEHLMVLSNPSEKNRALVSQYAKHDDRIRVEEHEGNGHGSAFNLGLMLAKGEYIGILDSKDYADINFYKTLYEYSVIAPFNVVKGNAVYHNEGVKKVVSINESVTNRYWKFTRQPWTAIYYRNFLLSNAILMAPFVELNYAVPFLMKVGIFSDIDIPIANSVYMNHIERAEPFLTSSQVREAFEVYIKAASFLLKMRICLDSEHVSWVLQDMLDQMILESSNIEKSDDTAFSVAASLIHNFITLVDKFVTNKGEAYAISQRVFNSLRAKNPTLDLGKLNYHQYLKDWLKSLAS